MKINLKIKDTQAQRVISIEQGESMIFGRSVRAGVILDDPLCSSLHFQVLFQETRLLVQDLRSKNGIYLNGQKCEEAFLYLEDQLKAGDSCIEIELSTFPEDLRSVFTNDINRQKAASTCTYIDDQALIIDQVQEQNQKNSTPSAGSGKSRTEQVQTNEKVRPARSRQQPHGKLQKPASPSHKRVKLVTLAAVMLLFTLMTWGFLKLKGELTSTNLSSQQTVNEASAPSRSLPEHLSGEPELEQE